MLASAIFFWLGFMLVSVFIAIGRNSDPVRYILVQAVIGAALGCLWGFVIKPALTSAF